MVNPGPEGSRGAASEVMGQDEPERGPAGFETDSLQRRELVDAGSNQDPAAGERQPARARHLHRQVAEGQEGRQRDQADHGPYSQVSDNERGRRQPTLT